MKDPLGLGHLASDLEALRCGVGKPIWLALGALLRALIFAHNVGRTRRDFAVEIAELKEFELGSADLRWLIFKGFIEHLHETTKAGDLERSYASKSNLGFDSRSCFNLTDEGLNAALAWGCGMPKSEMTTSTKDTILDGERTNLRPIPKWDTNFRVITYNGIVVKQFKLPSPNQIAILAAFEEEGWPPHIDDPLPPRKGVDSKQRLHDTIRSINRNQRHELICFRGDGTGRGIIWLPREESDGSDEAE